MTPPGTPPLTAERIRHVVEAHRARGKRGAEVAPEYARLRTLLRVLAGGTLENEVHSRRMALEVMRPLLARIGDAAAEPLAAELALLEGIRPGEVAATLASLDVLEPHFPRLVPAVRAEHLPAASPQAPSTADPRPGDPSRPELTPERIRELLDRIPRICERAPELGRFLFRPALPGESGRTAVRLLGRDVAKVVREVAGDVHAFARDVFWLHLITFHVWSKGSIDASLLQARAFSAPDAWKPLRRGKREGIADEVSGLAAVLARVGRAEEAAVEEVAEEARSLFIRLRIIH
ncbi:MAG TPA: hypothetical protein VFQ76_01050 [Longimicrobiaceae bacterium]|nr:hypothetical protein [Longimicrobiaceae bacterium]